MLRHLHTLKLGVESLERAIRMDVCHRPRKGLYPVDLPHQRGYPTATKDEQPVYKVTFEQMADFKFNAAYEAYSKVWDNQQGTEECCRLNVLIS